VGALYAPLGRTMADLMQQYGRERSSFYRVGRRSVEVLQQETLRLRQKLPHE
jgi:hypothetical protein